MMGTNSTCRQVLEIPPSTVLFGTKGILRTEEWKERKLRCVEACWVLQPLLTLSHQYSQGPKVHRSNRAQMGVLTSSFDVTIYINPWKNVRDHHIITSEETDLSSKPRSTYWLGKYSQVNVSFLNLNEDKSGTRGKEAAF